jgi:hypothetical protein
MSAAQDTYGLVAEFDRAEALLAGVRAARAGGYLRLEAYSPMPIEGLSEALGLAPDRIPLLALVGGLIGGVATFSLQWYSVASVYPMNVGGRTPTWPGLIPSTFEMTILGAVLAVFFGMLLQNGLPRLRHPLFNLEAFSRASSDRFFLCIQGDDPRFDALATRQFLEQLRPVCVAQVGMQDAP